MDQQPKFCRDCKHFNKTDTACDNPKNVKRIVEYDLVTGQLLSKPTITRVDGSAQVSRTGHASDTNCGFQAGWYETDLPSMAQMALERR